MFTLAADAVEVKPAALVAPAVVADDRARLEADYAAYSAWLDANADELAGLSDALDMMEAGYGDW